MQITAAVDINETMKRHRSSPDKKPGGSSDQSKAAKSGVQPLTCERETALIADYLASNLSSGVLASFEKHLEDCPDCKAFLQTYRKTIEITRSFFDLESAKVRPPKPARRAPTADTAGTK